jgi:competence protein ComEC
MVYGILDNSPDPVHGPIALRYRPRAILRPGISGYKIEKISEPDRLSDFMNRLRYRLMSHLSWGIGCRESELVAGITFGRKGRRFSGNWARDFYQAGLSHLIVASGAQVSLLFLPLMLVFSKIRIPKFARVMVLTLLAMILFAFARLLGGEPSILRAAVMGTILLISLGIDRNTFGLATLAATGWFWLIVNPLLINDISFLLSFAASFGIIYFSPPFSGKVTAFINTTSLKASLHDFSSIKFLSIYKHLQWLARSFISVSIITICAQLGVIPVLACTVGRITLAGFIANIIAVPIAQVILYLGALSGVGGFISPVISLKINHFLDFLARILMDVAHDFASIPNANFPIDPMPASFAIAWYLLFICIVENWRMGHYIELRRKMKIEPRTGNILELPAHQTGSLSRNDKDDIPGIIDLNAEEFSID